MLLRMGFTLCGQTLYLCESFTFDCEANQKRRALESTFYTLRLIKKDCARNAVLHFCQLILYEMIPRTISKRKQDEAYYFRPPGRLASRAFKALVAAKADPGTDDDDVPVDDIPPPPLADAKRGAGAAPNVPVLASCLAREVV